MVTGAYSVLICGHGCFLYMVLYDITEYVTRGRLQRCTLKVHHKGGGIYRQLSCVFCCT